MKLTSFLAALCILTALAAAPASATPTYSVTPLGMYGIATAINNHGQIAGSVFVNGALHAVVYDGTIHDLGTIPNGIDSMATAINNLGQVTGFAHVNDANEHSHAFLFDGTMHDLGALGGNFSQGYGINDAGHVVGIAETGGNFIWHAFLYDGTMHDLGTLGGAFSEALGINAGGQVVGWSEAGGFNTHAFLWNGKMHDLDALGESTSEALAINVCGDVVGVSGDGHAFLFDGAMHDLGVLDGYLYSSALAINGLGQIVGNCDTGEHVVDTGIDLIPVGPVDTPYSWPPNHPFFYDGTMHDLNDLIDPAGGWMINSASGINDSGWIIADASNGTYSGAVLLKPIPEPATATLALLAGGAAGCGALRRRRHS